MKLKRVQPPPVDTPADFSIADHAALKAVYGGTANEAQQKRAMDWIIKHASGVGAQSYRSDPHATAFMEGRRFVGMQLMALFTMTTEELKKRTTDGDRT